MTKKEEWLAGTRSAVPIMLGYVPVGIAYGVMARQAGLNTWQTVLMSLTVYGGASEMMAAGMVAQGAAVLTIVLTTFILNLRHIIMSTCVFNQMQGGRLPVRMLAAFGVTDETFAVYTTTANAPRTPRYFFSMALCSYLSWALGSWLGAILPVVALLNFLVFIWPAIDAFARRQKYRHNPQTVNFKKAVRQQQQQRGYHHKCAVCGRTDTDYPDLQFRYCSKCAGYRCFCQDHIFSHVHFTEEDQ